MAVNLPVNDASTFGVVGDQDLSCKKSLKVVEHVVKSLVELERYSRDVEVVGDEGLELVRRSCL